MRRFRNPRYAPESLERKLSPSGVSLPVTAEFAVFTSARITVEPPPVPDPTDPLCPDPSPVPGEPPSGGSPSPKGPTEPDIYRTPSLAG